MEHSKLNILIIDDHPLFRKGMISILQNYTPTINIYEANRLNTAEDIILNKKIDLVTLDLNLPEEDGTRFLIKYAKREFKVLVITSYNSSFLAKELLNKGANGYIKKENLFENLIEGIEKVMNGEIFMDEKYEEVEDNFDSLTISEMTSKYFSLTQAEKDIFKLLAEGKNPKEIASITGKSYKTVENQKSSIISKMSIKSEIQIYQIALRLNLISI